MKLKARWLDSHRDLKTVARVLEDNGIAVRNLEVDPNGNWELHFESESLEAGIDDLHNILDPIEELFVERTDAAPVQPPDQLPEDSAVEIPETPPKVPPME